MEQRLISGIEQAAEMLGIDILDSRGNADAVMKALAFLQDPPSPLSGRCGPEPVFSSVANLSKRNLGSTFSGIFIWGSSGNYSMSPSGEKKFPPYTIALIRTLEPGRILFGEPIPIKKVSIVEVPLGNRNFVFPARMVAGNSEVWSNVSRFIIKTYSST